MLPASDHVDYYFNQEIKDPYQFLEENRSELTKNWLAQEQKIHSQFINSSKQLFEIEKRINDRSKTNEINIVKQGNYFFHFNFSNKESSPNLYISKGIKKASHLLIDPSNYDDNILDKTSITGFQISTDNRFLAFCLSKSGSEWKEIKVISLPYGKELKDQLYWVKQNSIAWFQNGFYYTRFERPPIGEEKIAINLNSRIYYHRLGTLQEEDELIFEQPALPMTLLNVQSINSEKVIIYGVTKINQQYFNTISINQNAHSIKDFKIIAQSEYSTGYTFEAIAETSGKLLVYSNYKSKDKRLVYFDLGKINEYTEIFKENEDILRDVLVADQKIICLYSKDMNQYISVNNFNGKELTRYPITAGSAVYQLEGNFNDSIIYFYKNSYFLTPQLVSIDLRNLELIEIYKNKKQTAKLISEQKFYKSSDGTLIPITLVHQKDLNFNADNPTILLGYGGFGVPILPFYDAGILFFIENGGVLAVPGIRGGGEYGENWHEQGRLFNKQNAINDFVYAGKFLIKNRYTNSSKLIARGSSNGAMIAAAAINQNPDLFKVGILEMGIYDLLKYQEYTTGYSASSEYGTSNDPQEFKYLLSYSPLHNIPNSFKNPAIYIITGDNDERVPPLHSYKYCAALQNKSLLDAPIIMNVQENVGHLGAQSFEDLIRNEANIYSFIFEILALKIIVN